MSMASNSESKQDLSVFSSVRDLGPDELMQFLEQTASLLPEELRNRLRSHGYVDFKKPTTE